MIELTTLAKVVSDREFDFIFSVDRTETWYSLPVLKKLKGGLLWDSIITLKGLKLVVKESL